MSNNTNVIKVASYQELENSLVDLVVDNMDNITTGTAQCTDSAVIEISVSDPEDEIIDHLFSSSDDKSMVDWIHRLVSKRFLTLDSDSGIYHLIPENIDRYFQNREKLRETGARLDRNKREHSAAERNKTVMLIVLASAISALVASTITWMVMS